MIKMTQPGQFRITVTHPSQIDAELCAAELLVRPYAHDARQGILVTRLDHGKYTVAPDASVPYGVTDERDTAL
ncbi:hypothetical protein FDW83_10715 [Pseudarthrobacter sp. NamE2]|uniref:hypothetical protein n=1 Tax=Pseudarthrobacter sp. NamE2 TaxID=2576838 RepID=UPI0010FD367C|nr:hypothetical protein [Pseudarthrobacter sp. NamE2]TLM83418.1 hypothetical protein FDW83_10715 [Pseudarthrobacter sp. NamE2]